ncbi:MAG: methionine ABC transporter permease, partial [Deltaproteobacteria bacterium]|nr:methionine ABC transporter permease [Deltaproteobacteria bacterium]
MFLSAAKLALLKTASLESLYMVSLSAVLTAILGIPLGILLVICRPGHILASRPVSFILGSLVNVLRSIPFPIFIVFVIPLTRL